MQQAKLFDLGERVAGIDEAGRGPLAGPVVAAAVILDPDAEIDGLDDSKKLTAKHREILAGMIKRHALAWAVASADRSEIDAMNILAATMLAMRRAIAALAVVPSGVLVDGNRLPDLQFSDRVIAGEAVVGGDASIAAISAASILAKTTRDRTMTEMDALYPGYGFARHKGYGTQAHLAALRTLGPCAEHRRSFKPVRDVA